MVFRLLNACFRNLLWLLIAAAMAGCGTTETRSATDQLLLSDAVDKSIAALDFRTLSGRKVYVDTQFIRNVKGAGFVNAEYITSALRQQVVAAGCKLMDKMDEADVVVEPRVGALGADGFKVMYGIPGSSALSSAAELLPSMPAVPVIPELAMARRESQAAAAKIAVFAYDRETREPLWQSGIARSEASARDTWFLGVGPFQAGSIHDGTRLVGGEFLMGLGSGDGTRRASTIRPAVPHDRQVTFEHGWPVGGGYPMPGQAPAPEQLDPTAPSGEERIAAEGAEKEAAPTEKR